MHGVNIPEEARLHVQLRGVGRRDGFVFEIDYPRKVPAYVAGRNRGLEIFVEMRRWLARAEIVVKKVLAEDPDIFDPKKYGKAGRDEVQKYVEQKMDVVGSTGRA